MKIAIANPPWRDDPKNGWGVRAGSRWSFSINKNQKYYPFPFFLAYSAALLKRETNNSMKSIDAITVRMSRENFIRKTKNSDVVIMEGSTVTLEEDLKTAYDLKKENPDIKIIFTGPHATAIPEDYLRSKNVDFVCIGEYEYTLLELIRNLKNSRMGNVKGIAFQKNGKIIKTNARPTISNLDQLPFPVWEDFPMYRYNETFCSGDPNVQLSTSRGCVYKCPFCMWPQVMYKEWKWRPFSVKYILSMIDYLQDNYYFNEYYFDDDTFNLREKKDAFKLFEGFKSRDIQWSSMSHFAVLTEDEIIKMADSGMRAAKFGIESGSEKILETTLKNKCLNKEMIKRKLKLCKESGIETHVTFTMGLPNETKRDIDKTIDFLFELYSKKLIDTAQFSISTPFPGTQMFYWAKEKGYLKYKDWSDFDGIDTSVLDYPDLDKRKLEKMMMKAKNVCNFLYFLKNKENTTYGFTNKAVSTYFFMKEPMEILRRFDKVLKMVI
jgi:radical SAM superfamily enzyme YgiQ (UPF0313 family)